MQILSPLSIKCYEQMVLKNCNTALLKAYSTSLEDNRYQALCICQIYTYYHILSTDIFRCVYLCLLQV